MIIIIMFYINYYGSTQYYFHGVSWIYGKIPCMKCKPPIDVPLHVQQHGFIWYRGRDPIDVISPTT